jgi:hypothetical protein
MYEDIEAGHKVVKRHVYLNLESEFPQRTWKAFERKFQNISAVLDMEGRP